MPSSQPRFEEIAGQRLPLGGMNGYLGVRGKQGRQKNMFQGMTPKKQHRTKLFGTAQEAAIALAQLREDMELGMHWSCAAESSSHRQPPSPPRGSSRSARTSGTSGRCHRLLLSLSQRWPVPC